MKLQGGSAGSMADVSRGERGGREVEVVQSRVDSESNNFFARQHVHDEQSYRTGVIALLLRLVKDKPFPIRAHHRFPQAGHQTIPRVNYMQLVLLSLASTLVCSIFQVTSHSDPNIHQFF